VCHSITIQRRRWRGKASGFNSNARDRKGAGALERRLAEILIGAARGGLVVFASLIVLAGCESPASKPSSASGESPRTAYNLSGYPPAFKDGYADACSSPRRRNDERFKSDADYSMGWNDGQSACRGR